MDQTAKDVHPVVTQATEYYVKKVGEKWYVLDSSGKKVLGKHTTKKKAISQLSAIEISKKEKMEGLFPSFSLFLDEEIKTTLQYHKTLNPKLWNGFDLKPEVKIRSYSITCSLRII